MREVLEDLNSFSVDVKNREIFIHRYYNNSDDCDVENKMSSMFIKNIRALDQKPAPILIHLNAGGGGEWEEGMSMYDAITFTQSYITVLIYGYACSMSSIIPQAADYRVMMPNSYLMCHYGSDHLSDNYSNNKKYFNFAIKMRKKMIDIYASRMQSGDFVTEKKKKIKDPYSYISNFIQRKMEEGDWYMTAEEAVYYGLADDIMGSDNCSDFEVLKNV